MLSKVSSKTSQSLESISKLGRQTSFSYALTVRRSTCKSFASSVCDIFFDFVGKRDIDTENISKPKELKKYIEEKLVNPNAIRPMIVD